MSQEWQPIQSAPKDGTVLEYNSVPLRNLRYYGANAGSRLATGAD
jgi:hypothetical protein